MGRGLRETQGHGAAPLEALMDLGEAGAVGCSKER